MTYDFLFRFDANSVVGAGHLQRSLSLIQPLMTKAYSISCMGDYSEQYQVILDGIDIKCFKPCEFVRAKCIVIDHYEDVESLIDGLAFDHIVLFVDQESRGHSLVDLVISPFGDANKLSELYPNASVMTGIEYLSFRPEVLKLAQDYRTGSIKKRQREKPLVIVSLGGTDQRQTLKLICRCLTSIAELVKVRVMSVEPMEVPEGFELIVGYDTDFLTGAVEADLVICGVGQTFIEISKIGVNAIGIVLAQNQLSCAEMLSEKGGRIIGSFDRLEQPLTEKLKSFIEIDKDTDSQRENFVEFKNRSKFLGEMMASKSELLMSELVELIS